MTVINLHPEGRGKTAGSNAPGAFLVTPPSGRGLVIPFFFPWFCFCFFFGGHLPQTSGFRSAKEILVVSFATQARAFILSDCNIFYTPWGGGGITAGSNAPGAFLVFFFLVVTCPRPPVFARPKKYSLCLSLHSQRLLSWVTATYFTPPRGEGENNGGV